MDPTALAELVAILDSKKMSQSLFRGLWLALRLDAADDWTSISELAEMSSLTPSTVHRYLATLLVFGIVEQHSHSRRYRIKDRR
jgi:DNA-binding IclR family transcriptional regulator